MQAVTAAQPGEGSGSMTADALCMQNTPGALRRGVRSGGLMNSCVPRSRCTTPPQCVFELNSDIVLKLLSTEN
ncbi:hypothetical protein MATL_G00167250 [Megalops atlanticus]|uniref:Uncharacterized protein n=1 Tax=Megalops atlanticus TaxID=7932 RepID=A0A9D3T6U4_MEGAT|nr:hypothetical protein MATL_G00167250 [Megalops atlanticus]